MNDDQIEQNSGKPLGRPKKRRGRPRKEREENSISSRLTDSRVSKRLTTAELARLSRVAQNTIIGLENGALKNPRLDTLTALANALEIDLGWLVTGR